jgi:hypothetical protein
LFFIKYLRNNKVDLIFFSTTSFHLFALGPILKLIYKVPFVLDIQDPWRSDFYLDKPKNERPPKFLLNYLIDKYLELFTIPKADGIVSVSHSYIDNFKSRYKVLTTNTRVIPFSATILDYQVDFDVLIQSKLEIKTDCINIVYVGRGGHDLSFAVNCFFSAVADMKSAGHEIYDKLKISFIGTSYAPNGKGRKTILPIAEFWDIQDIVVEHTDRVSYFDALKIIQNSSILFVPGSIDSGYTASKIYPYIMANKPILACFHESSSVVDILNNCTNAKVLKFNSNTKQNDLTIEFHNALMVLFEQYQLPIWNHNEVAMKNFMAPSMTKQVCSVFNNLGTNC